MSGRQHWPLIAIVIAFLALAFVYNATVPVLEAPDEQWHVAYVKYLADGHGLPVESPNRLDLQEAHHPPLYYALGALATFWINTDDLPALLTPNSHWGFGGRSPDLDNRNLFLHLHPGERFPYQGAALAIHIVRALSALAGAVTIASTYALALVIFPGRRWLALGAATFVAFNPQFLYLSASVNNDAFVAALCAVALVIIAQLARGQIGRGRLLALGAVIGLALLTKWSAVPLVAAALIALGSGYWAVGRRGWRDLSRDALWLLAPVVLLSGWWFVRNQVVYGDPLGLRMMLQLFPPRDPVPDLRQLLSELPAQERSFWASFGWENIYPPGWVYAVFLSLDRLAALGLLAAVVSGRWSVVRERGARSPALSAPGLGGAEPTSPQGLVLSARRFSSEPAWLRMFAPPLLFALLVFIAFIQWMRITYAVGRHLFPALPVIALLLMLGLTTLARFVTGLLTAVSKGTALPCPYGRGAGLLPAAYSILLFAVAVAAPPLWIAPAYWPPPPLTEGEIAAIPHRLDVDFGGRLRLLGYRLDTDATTPGERLVVTAYWQALAPFEDNWTVFVHLLGENGAIVAQRDTYPGLGRLPTSAMTPGQTFADTYTLEVPVTAYAPDAATLRIGLVAPDGVRVPASDSTGRRLGDGVALASVSVRARPGLVPNPLALDFGGEIRLSGYDLTQRTARPGESLAVTFYWQTLRPPAHNYTVFVHLVAADGTLWAQGDARPQAGWEAAANAVISDTHSLSLPPDLPPGAYDVQVGLYRQRTGKRLHLIGPDGQPGDDTVNLTRIRIEGSEVQGCCPANPR